MFKLKANLSTKRYMLLAVCFGSAILGITLGLNKANSTKAYQPTVLQESDEKVINWMNYRDEPLKFGNLSVKNTKQILGNKFDVKTLAEKQGGSTEDWLENLEFTLNNNSKKMITSISLHFEFSNKLVRETSVTGPDIAYPLNIGYPPEAPKEELKYFEPLALNPGEEFTMKLSAKKLNSIKKALAASNHTFANMSRLDIRIVRVIYSDGLTWSNGRNYRPNPSAPGGYELIDN